MSHEYSESLSSEGYFVPANALEAEYEIKKSRFIARAALAQDRFMAMEYLSQVKKDYPDARHHCWAYLIGDPKAPTTMAMSDDGEPSGTAGKPILNVLQHKSVGDVMLVVTRYFGGVKLGAGGLVRAYSHAAQAVMQALPKNWHRPLEHFTLMADFSTEQVIRHWLDGQQGSVVDVSYREHVKLQITLPLGKRLFLEAFLAGKQAELIN